MREAAALLVGEHDFSAFRSSECQARSPVRRLEHIAVERRGDYLIFDFRANAFLHHMVRNLVGTLVYVGSGRHEPQWVGQVLLARDRSLAAPTFDAAGLYLARVDYDASWGLPDSVGETAGFVEDCSRLEDGRQNLRITRVEDALAAARCGAHAIGSFSIARARAMSRRTWLPRSCVHCRRS